MSRAKEKLRSKSTGWLQSPLWEPARTWQAPSVASLPSWTDAKRICLDVECRDVDLYELGPGVRRGGYVCGVAVAFEDGPAYYLPIRHEGGGNLLPEHVWGYLRAQAAAFEGEIVLNMGSYDLDYLFENGVHFPKVRRFLDVQNAEPILDELQKTYGLDAICARRGIPGKDEAELRAHAKAWGVDPKTGMWRLHAAAVGRYAEQDVRVPLVLMRLQEKELAEQDLLETFDMECRLQPVLVRMTRRGIRVDLDEMDRVEAWAKSRLADYLGQIKHLTNVQIGSISNAAEVARALKARGLDVPMRVRKGTGPGTDKPPKLEAAITKLWLQQQTDEVALAVVSGREFAKLLGTYVAGFRKHLVGDRLHPSIKQQRGAADDDEDEDDEGGARFGRCATTHPNIQAQMKRSKEILKRWRRVLVADAGKKWVSGDFCHSADTEVLTPRGWVRFDQLALTDEVAQWDDGAITFVPPTAHYRKEFDGELVEIHSRRRYSAAVTGNHGMIFRGPRGDLQRLRADQLSLAQRRWRLPQCGQLVGGVSEDPDVLRLVVAIQADATDRGPSWRFWFSRTDKITRIRYLLDRLGIKYTTGFSPAKANQTSFQFRHDARVDRYLSRKDKTFDRAALLGLDRSRREVFLDELPFWDGDRTRRIYLSTNLTNIETVQIVSVLTGRCANKHVEAKRDRRPLGRVAPLSHEGGEWDMVQWRRVAYRGDVYCVTVPAGAILTRRHDKVLVSSNSSQEPRWTVHYAEICKLPGARQAGDAFRSDPLLDPYKLIVDLVKTGQEVDLGKLREDMKEVYLGRCYGMAGGKMAHKLRMPTVMQTNPRTGYVYEGAGPECQALIDRFDRGVPYVRALANRCKKAAKAKGYILGVDKRHIRFELLEDGKLKDDHKALNKLIQYAAAWQTKTAAIALDAEGFPTQMTVHDEFDYSETDPDRARLMGEIMCEVHRLLVPSRVDVKWGPSYGETSLLCSVTSKGFDLKVPS